ncbi:MAG TPA: hypothetical protein VHC91_21935 [Trinickia sp.]|uniref:hypothetical protein n=1 Tax=Trinickia sp. TaxID=2571163 RepID=UPI002CAC7A99|nr:hypothetical protein [Trinickia sp.]HVW53025.1 hypothetical protein [Trinickia sp.]
MIVPAAPGTIAYTDTEGCDSVEPVIAYSIELYECIEPDGFKSYTHWTTVLGIDGEINHYTAIVLPDGAMALEYGRLQTVEQYRNARKLAIGRK